MRRTAALLATGRVANLPSVWTHVLVGVVLGSLGGTGWGPLQIQTLVSLLVGASLLYLGGCFLGDALDAEFDRANRPERPIPRGILSVGAVAIAARVLLIGGWLAVPLATLLSHASYLDPRAPYHDTELSLLILRTLPLPFQFVCAAPLLACIVSYAWLHKRVPWLGLILMGGCRGLLVAWAAVVAQANSFGVPTSPWPPNLPGAALAAALASALYTIGFVLVARTESKPEQAVPARLVRLILLGTPVAALVVIHTSLPELPATRLIAPAAAVLIYLRWTLLALRTLPRSKPAFVSRCLAGFCLLDTAILALANPPLAPVALAAFLLALGLQRATPAT